MKAEVRIAKSFDDGGTYSKNWESGDFKFFLEEEGKYLDELCGKLEIGGTSAAGDGFTVIYTITVTKWVKNG